MDLDFLRQKDFSDDRAWKKAFDLALAVWRVSHFAPSFAKATEGEKTTEDKSVFSDMSKEMLKRKLRKLASEIISELAPKSVFDNRAEEKLKLIFETIKKIESLRAHLRLVQNLKLTKEINCQVLDKEYRLLKEELLREALVLAKNKDKEILYPLPRKDEFSTTIPSGRSSNFAQVNSPCVSLAANINRFAQNNNNGNGSSRLTKIINYIKENKVVQLKEVLKFFPEYSEKTIRNDLKMLCGRNFIERLGKGAGSCYRLLE